MKLNRLLQITFRLISPPTPFEGLEQNNSALYEKNVGRISEQFPNNDIRPRTNWTLQPPTLIRNEKPHPKLYLVKREESNRDNDLGVI